LREEVKTMSAKAAEKMSKLASNGVHAIKSVVKPKSIHAEHMRSYMAKGAAMALVSGALALLAIVSMKKAKKCVEDHRRWEHEDRKLDEALNESLDASDAVATY